jgi:DNA polymerase I-like protein with 3'-5' exonuclease and polymerase domains
MSLLFLDAETFFSDEYSLKRMTTQAYIRDARFKVHGWGVASSLGDPLWLTGMKAAAFLAQTVPVSTCVVHNAHFDVSILSWCYGLKPKRIIDTLSLSRAIIGASLKSHSLDNVAKFLGLGEKSFGLAVSKGKRQLTAEEDATLGAYCKHDVELCRGIFLKLIAALPREELPLIDWVARAFTEPTLLLDGPMLEAYHAHVVEQKAAALVSAGLESRELLMSNQQYGAALQALGATVPMKLSPTTGKETFAFAKTDEEHIALLEHDDLRVQALVAARLEVKSTIEETRAKTYLEASALGAWPVGYSYSGAQQTHRFSGTQGNPQNLAAGGTLRNAIQAPDGYTLVVGDLAQVELRITLALAGDIGLEKLRAGEDLYLWFASQMYQKEITDKKSVERKVAKSAVLGLGFGMGADKFHAYCSSKGIAIDDKTAERAVALYRRTFPGVVRLWRIADRALPLMMRGEAQRWPAMKPLFETGFAPVTGAPGFSLPGGLWVKYPGLCEDNGEWTFTGGKLFSAMVVANAVQATARKIIMEQLVEVHKHLPVVLTTHDEIVALVPESKARIAEAILKKIMSTSPSWWPELPLAVETGSAKRYGEAKK